jgi:CheY-like chemotaxis protein
VKPARILVVEDKEEDRELIASVLLDAGYETDTCSCAEDAQSLIAGKRNRYDIVVLDLLLGHVFEPAFYLLDQIRRFSPATRTIVLSSHGTAENAVRAVKTGAFDFVDKPFVSHCRTADISAVLLPKIQAALCSDDYDKMAARKRFLEGLSEDELIDEVLIPLLKKMGYLGVQRIAFHGPGEHGKDLLPCYKYGDFNERIYYAAQVKAGRVSASSSGPCSVQTLLNQIQSVLLFSFVDKFDGCRKKVDRCLAVCSGHITNEALTALEAACEGRRDIVIVRSDDLIDLLRRWNLLEYFDRISRQGEKDDQKRGPAI